MHVWNSRKKKIKKRKPKEIPSQFHFGLGSAPHEVTLFPLCCGRQEMPLLAYANLIWDLLPINNMIPSFFRAQFQLRGWNYSLSQPLPSPNVLFSISKQLAQECTSFIRGDLICCIWQTLKHCRPIHSESHQDQITNTAFLLPVTGNQIPCTCLHPWTLLLSQGLRTARGVCSTLIAVVIMSAMFKCWKEQNSQHMWVPLLWKTKTNG